MKDRMDREDRKAHVVGGGCNKIPEIMWKDKIIGLPVIISYCDSAIHYPLGESTDKGKTIRESEDIDDERKAGE